MSSTAVVILAFNNEQFLKKFLPTLIQYTAPEVSIWIVDNASSDNTEQLIRTDFSQVLYLKFSENFGFAAGYNKAIASIEADNLVLLNSDVQVSAGWLSPLLDKLSKPNVGAVQPKIKSFHQKTHFEYAGASGGYLDALGYPYCRGRIFDTLEEDLSQYETEEEIFWATGACLAVKRENFLKVGGFDADFFAHMEEIDICWRLKMAGFSNYCLPSAVVYHVGGGTLEAGSPRKTYLNFRNSLLMLFKNLPLTTVFPIILMRLLLDGVVAIKYVVAGDFKLFIAVLKSHFSFYAMIPKYLGKRRGVEKAKVTRSPFSIVWQYFVLGKKTFNDIS